jgi:hypothetical protein
MIKGSRRPVPYLIRRGKKARHQAGWPGSEKDFQGISPKALYLFKPGGLWISILCTLIRASK